ncbi:biopolymer transporter ExbD [Verrucomicrobiales bacterium]|nr:biopolymer transporter ExbD [Verrucomicrobiales bacterium]MDB4359173.1 biopolymer transporter ExbD [Verrucomicrobiales bacterium]
MNIYRKRRQRPAVPIITLIDILAILLIFFIVTTTFKTRESLLKVNLPSSTKVLGGEDSSRRVTLLLSADGRLSLADRILPVEQLAAALNGLRRDNPDARLELKADEGAPLGSMVKVWDAAAEAGLEIGDLPLRIVLKE